MVAFPVTLADFFADVGQIEATFDLPAAVEVSETAGGEIVTSQYGARLWQGTASIRPHYHARADAIAAMMDYIARPEASLLVSPVWRRGPQSDPEGAVLGASTPTITGVDATIGNIQISGLPVGYVLSRGDYLSFQYGSDPVRYGFHQVLTGGAANGSGVLPVKLTQATRAGLTTPTAVKLVEPILKAKFLPGSASGGAIVPLRREGMAFAWRQTLR